MWSCSCSASHQHVIEKFCLCLSISEKGCHWRGIMCVRTQGHLIGPNVEIGGKTGDPGFLKALGADRIRPMLSSKKRLELLRQTAERGKYAPLYHHLRELSVQTNVWDTTFGEIEKLLKFPLPNSARIHRPWWANQGERGGHSHALAWEMAGWKTEQVDMIKETVVFVRHR